VSHLAITADFFRFFTPNLIMPMPWANQGMGNFVKQSIDHFLFWSNFAKRLRETDTFFVKMTTSCPLFGPVKAKNPASFSQTVIGQKSACVFPNFLECQHPSMVAMFYDSFLILGKNESLVS
jgi:hypothetical protein